MAGRIRSAWQNLSPNVTLPDWFDKNLLEMIQQVFSHDPVLQTFPDELRELTRSVPESIRVRLAG